MSDNVFTLAGIEPDQDSRKLFANLMKQADGGELVGAIVIAMCRPKAKTKRYYLSLSGWAADNPTFSAGAMSACLTLLNELALKKAGLI